MDWLTQYWVWAPIGVAFVAMHLIGHSGHSRHRGQIQKTISRFPDKRRDQRAPTDQRR